MKKRKENIILNVKNKQCGCCHGDIVATATGHLWNHRTHRLSSLHLLLLIRTLIKASGGLLEHQALEEKRSGGASLKNKNAKIYCLWVRVSEPSRIMLTDLYLLCEETAVVHYSACFIICGSRIPGIRGCYDFLSCAYYED